MVHTYQFDLIPESGVLPDDELTWRRVQFPLLEFQPAKRVTRLENPTRIHVEAFGEPGDEVPTANLARLEELCGTRLHQVACNGLTPNQFVAELLKLTPELGAMVEEQLEEQGELLIHLLMPDLLAHAVRWFESGDHDSQRRLLTSVEHGLRLGDYAVVNAVCVSFVEHVGAFPGETEAFIATWPPRLLAEYHHMQ